MCQKKWGFFQKIHKILVGGPAGNGGPAPRARTGESGQGPGTEVHGFAMQDAPAIIMAEFSRARQGE